MEPKELIDLIEFQAGSAILWTFMSPSAVLLTDQEFGTISRHFPNIICHCSPRVTKVMGLIVIRVCYPADQKVLVIPEYEKMFNARRKHDNQETQTHN